MKKRVLSLLCALTMIGTMFSAMAVVNAEENSPEMVISVKEEVVDESLADYQQYVVTVSLKNIPDVAALSSSGNSLTGIKYTGKVIKGFQAYLTYDNTKYIPLAEKPTCLITTGTFTPNIDREKGIVNFNWTTPDKDEMITNGTIDLITLAFASADASMAPGEKLPNNENILGFSTESNKDSKVEIAVFESCAAGSYTTSSLVAPATLTNVVKPLVEKTPYAIEKVEDNNKDEVAEGEKYTQGFKATVTPNNDVVKAVKAILSTAGYPDYAVEWSTPFEGEAPYTFAVNVINVPYTATVSAAWDVTVE